MAEYRRVGSLLTVPSFPRMTDLGSGMMPCADVVANFTMPVLIWQDNANTVDYLSSY